MGHTASREAGEPASEFLECLDPESLPRVVIGDERFLRGPEGQDCSTVLFYLLHQVS